jgi:predicted transposase YdaD
VEGWEEAKKEDAKNLLALGVSPATVAKATGLDMETVKRLFVQ